MIHFLDITVDTSQRSLYKDGNKVKTSTLNFDLLVYFIQNSNKIISRDELMQNVWNGRIVSDATVYKQVKRLKTDLLDHFSDEELIQTVHGQGFMFVTKVEIIKEDAELAKTNTEIALPKRKFSAWLLLIPVLSIVVFAFFQIKSMQQNNLNLTHKVERLAILYQEESQETNTANRVIAQALRAQMLMSDSLNVKLEKNQSNENTLEQTSTTIIQELGYDHVLTMHVIPHEHGVKARISLRQKNLITSINTFQASSYRELTNEISDWVQQQLQVETPSNLISNMTDSESAFNDYMTGTKYLFENKVDLSIQFLEKAIEKDPSFSSALIALSRGYQQKGQIGKALKTLGRIELSKVSDRVIYEVNHTRGLCYYRLGQLNNAVTAFGDALIFAKKLQDSTIIASTLINQAYMYSDLQQSEQARENLEEAMFHIDKKHQKSLLAGVYGSLSSIYQNNINNTSKALEYAELSHENFDLAGDQRRKHIALSHWAHLLLQSALYSEAYDKAQQAVDYSETNNDVVNTVYALKYLIIIDMLYGRFDDARLKLDKYHDNMQKIENGNLLAEYYKHEFDYYIYTNQLSVAADFLEKLRLQSMAIDNPDIQKNFTFAKIEFALQTKKGNNTETQLLVSEEPTIGNLNFQLMNAKMLVHNNKLEQATVLMKQSMNIFQKQGNNDALIKSINIYLKFMLNQQIISPAVSKWLNIQEDLSPPPYPFLKYKALYLSQSGNNKQAVATMQQLKEKANQWWGTDDEAILLELHQGP